MLHHMNENQDKLLENEKRPSLESVVSRLLDFEKLKYCNDCGICTGSCPMAKMLPEYYNPRILLHSLASGDEKVLKSPQLWLCAWCYHCYRRCPQNLNLPEIFQLARRFAVECGYMEGFQKAVEIISENIPLPVSCSYVCFHPERAVKNKLIVRNTIQKSLLTARFAQNREQFFTNGCKNRIAVIGSGPAGLSAANELAKKGYFVTVFESSSSPGGMLRRCIPEHRLPKNFVDLDIMQTKDLGVEIKINHPVEGAQIKELLEEGYDAIFVATGANVDKNFAIQGEELDGVFNALDFLEKANTHNFELLETVSIIGGGNVAIDSARTALRHGAKDVTLLYRRSKEEIPASPWEIKEAVKEGVKIEFLVSPKRIIGENGRVTKIECIKIKLGEEDGTGRRKPIPIKGSEFTMATDLVIMAIGQFPDTAFLSNTVEITEQRTVATNPFTLETSSPSIFAGGDVVLGAGTLIEAVLAGKQAAFSIDCYLRGDPLDPIQIAEKTFGR
jgi:NADPH-dependent glutamate synthase beta subunit-like oxidoreductase